MATAPAPTHTHTPSYTHKHNGSFSSHARSNSGSYSSPINAPSSLLPLGALSTGASPNTTKILLLSGFAPSLKTRDIQALFGEWELVGGGLKIKWKDDESCYVIFSEPLVAKRAYLALISSPPPALQQTADHSPKLVPYTGEDVAQIIQAVQNRPRSRSNASQSLPQGIGAHARKSSVGSQGGLVQGGAGGGHARQASFGRGDGGSGAAAGQGMGHAQRGSRSSWGQQQLRQMLETEHEAEAEAPPVPALPAHLVNASPSNSSKSGSNSGDDAQLESATAAVAGLALEA